MTEKDQEHEGGNVVHISSHPGFVAHEEKPQPTREELLAFLQEAIGERDEGTEAAAIQDGNTKYPVSDDTMKLFRELHPELDQATVDQIRVQVEKGREKHNGDDDAHTAEIRAQIEALEELGVRNVTHIETWPAWFKRHLLEILRRNK